MVHCYTYNNGVRMSNCVNTKIYFILSVFGSMEDGQVNEIWGGYYWNNGGGTATPYSDGEILYIYESIDEAEDDDENTIELFGYEMLANMNAAESAYAFLEENCVQLGSITFPDPIGFNTEPITSSVTWTINNKEVQSLTINNKEIQSIVRVNDNVVLYQKDNKITTYITAKMIKKVYTITLYDVNDTPLPNKTLILYYHGIEYDVDSTTIVTNNLGQCTYNSNPFKLISVVFEGDSEYDGSSLTV